MCIKALILTLIIVKSGIGLSPDEAQYWTWSQELDWGYYSKPPGIAWQIWLTTSFLGQNVFGVRFGALCIGFCISLAVYAAACAANLSRNTAFWAGCIAAISPLGVYLSFAATTDGGAILFLTLAITLLLQGIQKQEGPSYLLIGLCIGLGALFKWTAFLFWPLLVVPLLFCPNLRKWSLVGAIALSLAALIPSLYWNYAHDWATFRHVGGNVGGGGAHNFIDFFGAQMGLLSPLFFILLFVSYFYLFKRGNLPLKLVALFPCALLFYLGASLFKKIQPNWAAYLYFPGILLAAWVSCECLKKGRVWLHLGAWLSTVSVAFLFMTPWLQQKTKLPIPYACNAFQQTLGGSCLEEALLAAGYEPSQDFVFSDKYQTVSLLSFYGGEQKRGYFFNVSGSRKNQFTYWPQMNAEQVGKNGYFVVIENTKEPKVRDIISRYETRLNPYFEEIVLKEMRPLFSVAGRPVKYALIFECQHYNGAVPTPLNKY